MNNKFMTTVQKMFNDQFDSCVSIDFENCEKLEDGTYRYTIEIPTYFPVNGIERRLNNIQNSFDRYKGKSFFEADIYKETDYIYLLDANFTNKRNLDEQGAKI